MAKKTYEIDAATGATIIPLKYPLKRKDGSEVAVVHLRRAKVNDLLTAQASPGADANREIALFSALTKLPITDIGELDQYDYLQLQTVYKDFLS